VRLVILAVLREASCADFSFLRDSLDLTDGILSRHTAMLEEAGLVKAKAGFEDRRPGSGVQRPPGGRAALKAEMTAPRELIARVDGGSQA
jgi:DNA-binding MarR family transcriptional regulator